MWNGLLLTNHLLEHNQYPKTYNFDEILQAK